MIKEIELKNFRPHDHIILKNLSPNLNVIIGNTGTGKTSIIRALRLLLNNEPSGGAKLYKFKEKSELFIKAIVNNYSISRKAKQYRIKNLNSNDDSWKLSAFGKSVPQPVKDIINLQDINWQLQIHPHFLVLKNGGEVAKYLNPIMGSEESDKILNKIKEHMGKLRGDFKLYSSIASDNEKIVKQLQNIGEYKKEIDKIQNHIRQLQGIESLIFSISGKVLEIQNLNKRIIDPIKLNSFIDRINKIESKVIDAYHLELDINRLTDKISKLKSIKFIEVKPYLKLVKEIEKKQQDLNNLQKEKNNIQSLIQSYKTIDEALSEGLKEYDKIKNRWDTAFSILNICPLCGGSIKKNAKDHIHNRRSCEWKKPTLQVR